jgi:LacI family transcriptional regulator
MKARVTTSDVARAAGVHQTTVSLALRNDPRLRASTVQPDQRDRGAAGLRARSHAGRPRLVPSIPPAERAARRAGLGLRLADARRLALQRDVPVLLLRGPDAGRRPWAIGWRSSGRRKRDLSPQRLSEILYARGMLGLILAPQPDGVSSMTSGLVPRFSVVTIGPTLRQPAFHQVSNDQFHTVMRLCESLAQRGFRRIGYSIERAVDDRMDGQWSAAYDRFHRDLPAANGGCRDTKRRPAPATLRPWLRLHRPDVVISCADRPGPGVSRQSWRRSSASRTASALIGVAQPIPDCLGMHEDPENVGATAVEKIVGLIHIGERGIPAIASRTLIESSLFEPQKGERAPLLAPRTPAVPDYPQHQVAARFPRARRSRA